uniref:Uncharacterized protein n=1 Tax=Paramormyrops kingsleyae TaxID=1676925 RepID=A0A3B3SIP8_9TELE
LLSSSSLASMHVMSPFPILFWTGVGSSLRTLKRELSRSADLSGVSPWRDAAVPCSFKGPSGTKAKQVTSAVWRLLPSPSPLMRLITSTPSLYCKARYLCR